MPALKLFWIFSFLLMLPFPLCAEVENLQEMQEDIDFCTEQISLLDVLIAGGLPPSRAERYAFAHAENFLNLELWELKEAYYRRLWSNREKLVRTQRNRRARWIIAKGGLDGTKETIQVIQSFLVYADNNEIEAVPEAKDIKLLVELARLERLRAQKVKDNWALEQAQSEVLSRLPTSYETWQRMALKVDLPHKALDFYIPMSRNGTAPAYFTVDQIGALEDIARLDRQRDNLREAIHELDEQQLSLLREVSPAFQPQHPRTFFARLSERDRAYCCGDTYRSICRQCPVLLPDRQANTRNGKAAPGCVKTVLSWVGYSPERFVTPSRDLNLAHHHIEDALTARLPDWKSY